MKKHLWAVCFSVLLVAFTAYIALDTFVLAASYNTNAVEMNTSMFAETATTNQSSPGADESNAAAASAEAQQNAAPVTQTGNTSGEPAAADSENSTEQSGNASGEPAASENENDSNVDSTSGASETQSGSASDEPSGEMSGWGRGGQSSRGSASGEMFRPGSSRSSSNSSNTDSTSSTDSSSGRSSRSSRRSSGWGNGWSDWGGNSEWESSSGWGGGRLGRSSMSSAQSAEGVDASAEYSGDTTYKDDNVTISLTEYNQNNTRIYVADVVVSSTQYIKTAFANDTYGKNVTESTSAMAAAHNAILAINGDYYGAQERGFVIRNGIVYRNTSAGKDVMCIYADGTMGIVSDRETTAEQLVEDGVWQAFSFGPALIENGTVSVSQFDEVGMGMISNPRTAVGMIDTNHYVFVVSDGRTDESEGLSLYQLAQFMQSLGVRTAYNLDGGGSSTMYFNGQIVNNPTSTGGSIKERGVSDIVYIG